MTGTEAVGTLIPAKALVFARLFEKNARFLIARFSGEYQLTPHRQLLFLFPNELSLPPLYLLIHFVIEIKTNYSSLSFEFNHERQAI